MPGFIKLFGERNTATNAVKALMAGVSGARWLPATAAEIDAEAFDTISNDDPRRRERAIDAIFAAACDRSAWKHCATVFDDPALFEDCLVLFTVRHPASWLTGLFSNPYHALSPVPATLAEFLRMDWQTVARERLASRTFAPLDLYNAKLNSYDLFCAKLNSAGIPFRFIRFEDVVLAQEQVFDTLAADLGQRRAIYTPLHRSTKDPARDLDDYRQYYGQERWREMLSGSEEAINAQIDWGPLARFDYRPL